jgi:hypothetical protein
VLIQSPTRWLVLINAGTSTSHLSDALGRRLPTFYRSLDWLVVANIDNEDLDGVTANLECIRANHVLWSGITYGTRSSRDLWSPLVTQSIPVSLMEPGEMLDLGSGSLLSVVPVDAKGVVLLLERGKFTHAATDGDEF